MQSDPPPTVIELDYLVINSLLYFGSIDIEKSLILEDSNVILYFIIKTKGFNIFSSFPIDFWKIDETGEVI